MKKIFICLLPLVCILSGCKKDSPEIIVSKDRALEIIKEIDASYYWAERYVSKDLISPSTRIKYDYWSHEGTYRSPDFYSWLVCYDKSAYYNGGIQTLVFVNAETGEYVTGDIDATEIHVTWDSRYYYCPPEGVLPPWESEVE